MKKLLYFFFRLRNQILLLSISVTTLNIFGFFQLEYSNHLIQCPSAIWIVVCVGIGLLYLAIQCFIVLPIRTCFNNKKRPTKIGIEDAVNAFFGDMERSQKRELLWSAFFNRTRFRARINEKKKI